MRNDECNPDIHFMSIICTTMNKICDLSETLSPAITAWWRILSVPLPKRLSCRAHGCRHLYERNTQRFHQDHTGSGYEDGINCPGVFMWRLMISGPGRVRDTADIIFKQHLSHASFDIIKYDTTHCKDYAIDHVLVDDYEKLASPGRSRKSFPDAAY